ncbi:phosphatase PAP2 family protein [Pectinatus sottacetonis]|uniref:phosphatase PAP2 family protein n=1 Tax=Pectinatus sottacetonis TaxID=1002795 RepID=UPI0018C57F9C|nr:phosphatase PAP2 family protein [Pectinatus sottacetonis]
MENILNLDTTLIFFVQNHLVISILSPIMIGLSTIGNFGIIWILLGIVLFFKKRGGKGRKISVGIFISLGFSLVVGNIILKHMIMRVRPCIEYPWVPMLINIPATNNFSFPSGHTFSSFAAATILFKGLKKKWGIIALVLASGISFSRIYLFMHYPSDILAGIILGIGFGNLSYYLSGNLTRFNICQNLNCIKKDINKW